MARNRKRRKRSGKNASSSSSKDVTVAPEPAAVGAQPRIPPPSSTAMKPTTLEGFTTLPHELKKRILDLACIPFLSHTTAGPATRPHLDIRTTLNLAFSSRGLYILVTPILYSSVWITRPSSLASFHLALTSKPALGRLVKHLHVGPGQTSPHWNALDCDEGCIRSDCSNYSEMFVPDRYFLTTSLQSKEEAKLLPRWCRPTRRWALDEPAPSSAATAVWEALREAQWQIDIDLQKPMQCYRQRGWRADGMKLVDHTQRTAEAQAVLDLYLIELRRWEDARGIGRGRGNTCEGNSSEDDEEEEDSDESQDVKYPQLALTGYAASPARPWYLQRSDAEERIVIDRAQIVQHLARRKCEYDRFDHPVLFARSGEQSIWVSICVYDYGGRATNKFGRAPDEYWDELFSPDDSSPDYALPNTSTLGSLLSLLSSVLSHTTNIENLALTGFLERAACGTRGMAAMLKKLRTVSLGPPPLFTWYAPLPLQALCASVEELRLSGIRLHEEELDAIVKMFPRLKRFHWSMMYQFSNKHKPTLEDTVARLVGRKEALGVAKRRPIGRNPDEIGYDSERSSSDSESSSSSSSSINSNSKHTRASLLPLIEIKLYHSDLQQLLDRAPSPAARAAWLSGTSLPDLQERRLLLSESRMSLTFLYDEGKEWWERCGGVGRG